MVNLKQDYLGRTVYIDCPNISYSDSGSWCCKLYDPHITDPQKQVVKYGTCGANLTCPHKLKAIAEKQVHFNFINETFQLCIGHFMNICDIFHLFKSAVQNCFKLLSLCQIVRYHL